MTQGTQFQQLFAEFHQTFLQSEGSIQLAAYGEIRRTAYQNYQLLLEKEKLGQDLTELILLKLLPHANTANNRWRGAWTHVAPTIRGDIRRWYSAAGFIGIDEWPSVAIAVWSFVHTCAESPHLLTDACEKLSDMLTLRGFQVSMLTPILNALHPDQFTLINNRSRQVLNYFANQSFDLSISSYPEANLIVRQFIGEHISSEYLDLTPGVLPGDLFERFCFWLTSVRQLPLRSPRYWLIAAGEDGWQWEEWKDGDFAAIDWHDLGDLSTLNRAEFEQRRDSLIAQYNSWTKTGANQAWRFARQLKEGDHVVAFSPESVALGLGTVTGSYYYVPELAPGHRIPVRWHDPGMRSIHDLRLNRTLIEIDEVAFQQIREQPTVPDATSPTQESKTYPAYVDLMGFTLKALREMKQNASAEQLADAVTELVRREAKCRIEPGNDEEWLQRQIQRARHCLNQAALIDSPQRGIWRVTTQGASIALDRHEMERIYQEVEYQRQLDETLIHESPVIQKLTKTSAQFTSPDFANATSSDRPDQAGDIRMPGADTMSYEAELKSKAAPKILREQSGLSAAKSELYTLSQCANETGFKETDLARWVRVWQRKKQLILTGPSGTGKTFLAHHLAQHLTGGTDGFWELIQFHPAYAYEDFVQGLRPAPQIGDDATNIGPRFVMQPGRFLEFCGRATLVEGPAVLIIDEINRANLARVFGELMYLLEYRDEEAILAGNGQPFRIPQNVMLLGTMNCADRSIGQIDHALRRRFAFVELQPDYDLIRRYHNRLQSSFPLDALIHEIKSINQAIGQPEQFLGITYFLRPALEIELPDIWQTEIAPALRERFYDRPELAEQFCWERISKRLNCQDAGNAERD